MTPEAQHPRPPQYDTAIKRIEKKWPQEVEKIDHLLTMVNKQAFDNLGVYKPPKYPGMRMAFTKISFSLTPYGVDSGTSLPALKITEIDMDGFSAHDDVGPMKFETLYNRPFLYLDLAKQTGRTVEIEIFKLGQATGLGGRVTKEYDKARKQGGFSVDAEISSSLIKEQQAIDADTIVFHGRSMGAIKALETGLKLHQDTDAKIQLDLINPPWIPGLPKKFQPNKPQIIVGYVAQGIFNHKMKKFMEEAVRPEYAHDLRKFFEEKGIPHDDTFKQRLLKEKVLYQNVRNILKNKLHEQEDFPFPVSIQAGALDPINMSMSGLNNVLFSKEKITHGNITVDFALSTHSTNVYPVDAWVQSMQGIDVKPLENKT